MSKHTIRNSYRTITNPTLVSKGGEWFIAYSYRNDGQGRTYSGRERLGAIDRDEARVAFAAWQTTQTQLNAVSATKVLDELLAPYEESLRARDMPARCYLTNINALRPALGHTPISQVNRGLLNAFGKARGYKQETLRSYIGVINRAFRFAVSEGIIELHEQRRLELPARGAPRSFYLRQDEADAFYARAMAESEGKQELTEITKLVAIAMDTGARRQAILDLTWDRIDLRANTIDFNVPGRVVKNKRRVKIQIFKRLRPLLVRAHAERKSDYARVIEPERVDRLFAEWVASIPEWKGGRIANTTLHTLRHTFATLLILERKVPLAHVASLLGDNLNTVSNVYAHLLPSSEAFDL